MIRRWLVAPVLILFFAMLSFGAWAVASPLGAEPDSDFHLTSIWCQSAGADSRCERAYMLDGARAVKTFVAFDSPCFAVQPNVSAACQVITRATYFTERVNNGDYPTGYYAVAGLLASNNILRSLMGIRMLNAALFVLLITGVHWLADRLTRRALTITLGAVLVPVGVFFIPSVNPTSWAVSGITIQVFALLAQIRAEARWRALALGLLAATGGLMAAAARGDAGAYAIGVSVLTFWLGFPTLRRHPYRWLAYLVPITVGAMSFFGSSQTMGEIAGTKTGAADAFNFFNIVSLPLGNFGIDWGLGSLDTPMPSATWFPAIMVCSVVVVAGLTRVCWRRAFAVIGAGLAVLAIPYYALWRSGYQVGQLVQPRYILPLLIVFVAVSVWRPAEESVDVEPGSWALVVLGASVANSAALYANLLRYTNGSHPYLLGAKLQWWWQTAIPPQAVWVIGSFAFAYALSALVLRVRPRQRMGVLPRRSSDGLAPGIVR